MINGRAMSSGPLTAAGEVIYEDEFVPSWWKGDEEAVASAEVMSAWLKRAPKGK